MFDIAKRLKEKRPELSAGTLRTYVSLLNALHRRVFGDDDFDIDNFDDWESVKEDLDKKPLNSRKTVLSALYVLTELPKYNELMRKGIDDYNTDTNKREMNDKQKSAFKTQEEIREIFDDYQKKANLLYKKQNRNVRDVQEIQDFIILALCSGVLIAPRRSLDYTKFKIANLDDDSNYFRDGKEFVFRTYKTSQIKGEQVVPVPPELRRILKKWLLINPTDYLLHDVYGNPLNSTKLTQRLNRIFGGNFSINGLRHSYLSNKYQDTIKMEEEMKRDFEAMGSSDKQKNIYIQKIE